MYYNQSNSYKSKILKNKTIIVKVGAMQPQKIEIVFKQLPNWSYEVTNWVAFCHITWDKSLSAMKNWMNTTSKYFNNKKSVEKFFNKVLTLK